MSIHRKLTAILFLSGSLLILGGTAIAAPPSVVDQYTEHVPTPGGDKNLNNDSGDGAQNTGDGAQVGSDDGSAQQVGIVGGGGNSGGNGGSSGGGANGAESGSSGSSASTGGVNSSDVAGSSVPGDPLGADVRASDGNGMGWFFPLMLIAIVVATLGIGFGRRHNDHVQPG